MAWIYAGYMLKLVWLDQRLAADTAGERSACGSREFQRSHPDKSGSAPVYVVMCDDTLPPPPALRPRGPILDQKELVDRWGISGRTLEGWRQRKRGPPFLRLEGRVLYPLADVEAYEAEHLQAAPLLAAIVADSDWGVAQDADLPSPGTGDQP